MIKKIDITATGVVDSIRDKMTVADISKKGLLSAGAHVAIASGDSYYQNIVFELVSKAHAELIASVGSYTTPSLIGIAMGMTGGSMSGLPSELHVRTLCGIPCISTIKAFHRNGKNYIQIGLTSSISWSSVSAFCIYNKINAISIDGTLEYNLGTDTNLVNGEVL